MNQELQNMFKLNTLIQMNLRRVSSLFPFLKRAAAQQPKALEQQSYTPSLFLRHPLAQSIYNITEKQIKLSYHRQKIFFEDGGFISLDWMHDPKKEHNHSRPVVFVMHGLTGGSDNNYIKVIALQAQNQGYQVVCMNSRGVNNQMTSPIPFTALSHHQMEQAIKRVLIYYPDSPLFLVGTSFGGNYVMRYIINNSEKLISNIKAMVVMAPPFDIGRVIDEMPIIYQRFFLRRYLKHAVFDHPLMKFWEDIGIYSYEQIKKSQTLRHFHARCVSKILHFKDENELYEHYNIHQDRIADIKIPTLMLVSKDDPIVSYKVFPRQTIIKNANIKLIETQKGAHVCWFQGVISPKRWYPQEIIKFIKKVKQMSHSKLNCV